MKNKLLTILSVVAFMGGFLLLYFSGPKQSKQVAPITDQVDQQITSVEKWETKTDDQASVTVVVTPLNLLPQSKEWEFDVGMNTHSVELDQDPIQITILVDDKGNVYKPTSWVGAGPGGHHREGILTFSRIMPIPKSVEIKISSINDVVRSFTWQI